jgi:hypothetical protein
MEDYYHRELLSSISWRTIGFSGLLVPLYSSGGVFPLACLYQQHRVYTALESDLAPSTRGYLDLLT